MDKTLDVITIGECLLELSTNVYFENTDSFNLSFGGDIITFSAAAKRLGANVGVLSAIGNDYFKDVLLQKFNFFGFDISNIKISDEKNGLYLCGRNSKKEFVTYRRKTAGSSLSLDDFNEDYIKSTKAVYATGITQSLSIQANELVKKIFQTAKENDILTVYDPNYSSSLMTLYDTKEYLEDIIDYVDILFITLKPNVEPLYGLTTVEKIIEYFSNIGVKTIVVKSHIDNRYYVYNNGTVDFCTFYNITQPICTIGFGDVFNGGFLACLLKGYSCLEATKIAAVQAGMFVERYGVMRNIPYKEEILISWKRY